MPIKINHNQGSADSIRHLNTSYRLFLKSVEQLASGLRINRASDDPAGLVISEQLRAQIATLNQEIENTTMMIKKYNTADATVSQLYSILHGIRSMVVGAADDGATNDASREAYQEATDRAVDNYNQIIESAAFNNVKLFTGSAALADLSALDRLDLSSPEDASQSLQAVNLAMAQLNQAQIDIGSTQKYELEARRSNLEVTAENLTAAESQIRDVDYAMAMVDLIKNEFKFKAGVAMLAHANVTQNAVLSLLSD